MLHQSLFQKGAELEIPELVTYVPVESPAFVVLEVHAGGMGVCVRLRHTETKSEYALKFVRPDLMGNQNLLDRFRDELQVWRSASMCSLIAEAIAVVHININDSPCVVSPWMQMGDLANALPSLTPQHKFEILVRMVRGLSWVRDKLGFVHRDLKPANVLLDEAGLGYVADWGLARPVGHVMASVRLSLNDQAITRPDRTAAGGFLGTVTYAAPEQILGAPDVDHRADIYALGCMMFECETGSPPFVGQAVIDIARQHIQTPPPVVGGSLKRTELGLEEVISRCLAKRPADRYSNYDQLDEALASIARKHGFSLDRCTATLRYERSPLGEGHYRQNAIIEHGGATKSPNVRIVKFGDIAPFIEEASSLMALERYEEAEKLLQPHFIPELLNTTDEWFLPHTLALNYAYCLLKIGRLQEAIKILERLNAQKDKPDLFYVYYSLILLYAKKWQAANEVCERGLLLFPDDLDLMGNHTIALDNSGRFDAARESAIRRLSLRRDVHSIEEAIYILQRQAKQTRDKNLPNAVADAKSAWNLIKEGLSLNPRFLTLQLAEIQARQFAHDELNVVELCNAMIEADWCPRSFRQLAFEKMIETLADGKSFKSALDMIQRLGNSLSERVVAIKMRILARHFMIGQNDAAGHQIIIPEVRDYYLQTAADRSYSSPVIAAEILEWVGEAEKARTVLDTYLSAEPNDWEGTKAMALLRLRTGTSADALKYAQLLPQIAPWRAESYELHSYVERKANRLDVAEKATTRGDEVFAKEEVLFKELREYFDSSSPTRPGA